MTTPDLDRAFRTATEQILEDIGAGRVPADIASFSRLHDFVDANEYGDIVAGSAESWTDFGNELQSRLDAWLKAGRPALPAL
jgi:hypothetical protein